MKRHASVTLERVMELLEEVGLGVEPDAVNYECESCGECAVYGAEQLLVEMA